MITKPAPPERIEIRLESHRAIISGLSRADRSFLAGGVFGPSIRRSNFGTHRDRSSESPFITALDRDRFAIALGHVTRVYDWLKRQGHNVRMVDDRASGHAFESECIEPSLEAWELPEIVTAVRRFSEGSIEVADSHDAIRQAEELIRLYPEANTLLIGKTHDRAKSIRSFLDELLPTLKVSLLRRTGPRRVRTRKRVVAVTSLETATGEPADVWDLILYPELTGVLTEQGLEVARHFRQGPFKKRYAFHRESHRLTLREEIVLEAIAGPTILHRSDPSTTVRLHQVRAPHRKKIVKASGHADFYRQAVWTNEKRNERIAGLVRKILDGRRDDLRRERLLGDDERSPLREGYEPRVAILVANVEHGIELQQHLPSLPIERRGDRHVVRVSRIVTLARAKTSRLTCDVLVVASGDPALLTHDVFPGPEARPDRDVMVVVLDDAYDRFDPIKEHRVQQSGPTSIPRGWRRSTAVP